MPKRPRQHQLEDESRIAFRSVLPRAWVFRDMMPDYGIDAEVEIFDKEGKGTGKRFFVQLKATDEKKLNKALRVRFTLETDEYYHSLSTPILFVRYLASTRKFYIKWYHLFDPYYGKKGSSYVNYVLAREDIWTKRSADRLVRELDNYLEVKSSKLSVPLSININIWSKSIIVAGQRQLFLPLTFLT
jgi:hypothetical protein